MRGTNESVVHQKLKDLAVRFLKEREFTRIEIEYPLRIGVRNYIVDVVGLSPQKKIAIECGQTSHTKINTLRTVFDEVIVLTVNNLLSFYEEEIKSLNEEIKRLKNVPKTERPKSSKHVQVTKETWKRLSKLKAKLDKKSINDVIEELLDNYELYVAR